MSIIKIHLYREGNQRLQKYLLTYIQGLHHTVKDFVNFALKALQINSNVDDMIVQHDGYVIPQCLDGAIVSKGQIITLKIKNKTLKGSPQLGFWTAQQLPQQKIQKIVESQNQQCQSESTPKFSQNGFKGQDLTEKLDQVSSKKKKKKNHQPQIQQEEQSQQQQKIKKKHKKHKIQKKKVIESQKQSEQSEDEQLPRITKSKKDKNQKKKSEKEKEKEKINKQKSHKNKKIQSQDNEDQIQEEQKNDLKVFKISKLQSFGKRHSDTHEQKQQIKKPSRKQSIEDQIRGVQKQIKSQKKSQKQQKPIQQTKAIKKPQNYSQKRRIIQIDDIESSEQSSEQPKKKIKSVNSQNIKKVAMIPPALRNKMNQPPKPKPSFKDYQQQQWITITKQMIDKFNKDKKQGENFIQKNNLIKFKQIELDMQKFIPVTSEWIQATVDQVEKDGKLKLGKITQLGKQYREHYQICDYNMVQLQINRNFATKEQLQLISGDKNQSIEQVKSGQASGNFVNEEGEKKVLDDPKCSVQKFICGQVNYYFSDKNYPYDLFMQMHANKNPQKWIPIRFLLNFPKIKKILRDQNKLFEYLIQDEKKQQRNFEINVQTKMVRKKNALPETIQNNQIQNQQTNEINEQEKQ